MKRRRVKVVLLLLLLLLLGALVAMLFWRVRMRGGEFSPQRFGTVQIGMSEEQVLLILGSPVRRGPPGEWGVAWIYKEHRHFPGPLYQIVVKDGVVTKVAVYDW